MEKVIIIPETKEFTLHVSHENIAWTNKNLGEPKIEEHNVKYLAPFWLKGNEGITRLYHIIDFSESENAYSFQLGNSFILDEPLNELSQRRVFSYRSLYDFGFIEIGKGLLTRVPKFFT